MARLPLLLAVSIATALLTAGQDCAGARPDLSALRSSTVSMDPGIGPVADWLDDLIRELGGLSDNAASAQAVVDQEGGQLDEDSRRELQQYLERVEERIDTISNPNRSPSLDPPDAGSIDPTVNPTTLTEYADTCATLALEALLAALIDPIADEYVGTRIKTIKALLPEYRDLAGIEE